MEKLLAVNNSVETTGLGVEDTKFNKPYPALLTINISSECEESMQAGLFTLVYPHPSIDYIDEVFI